jgi:hypothetical protein
MFFGIKESQTSSLLSRYFEELGMPGGEGLILFGGTLVGSWQFAFGLQVPIPQKTPLYLTVPAQTGPLVRETLHSSMPVANSEGIRAISQGYGFSSPVLVE